MTIIIQVTESNGVDDSILIYKPQMFNGFSDPEFLSYVNDKVHRELNPPNMAEWELASVDDDTSHSSELKEVTEDLEDLKITPKRKRGRPKESKKKHVKIDENFMEIDTGINFMEIDTGINGILPDVMPC